MPRCHLFDLPFMLLCKQTILKNYNVETIVAYVICSTIHLCSIKKCS